MQAPLVDRNPDDPRDTPFGPFAGVAKRAHQCEPRGTMSGWLMIVLLLLLLLPLAVAVRRSTELFVLRASGGRTRPLRGRLPARLLEELSDVIQRNGSSGELRVSFERGEPVAQMKGDFSSAARQQVRNVLGQYPLAKIRAGAPVASFRSRSAATRTGAASRATRRDG